MLDAPRRFWVVKGRPSRNDLDQMLVPGETERWITRKPPRAWSVGDGIFFWKSSPALRLVGLGRLVKLNAPTPDGDTFFHLEYLTGPLKVPLTLAELRSDRAFEDASFLKAGAAGTVFPLSTQHVERLMSLLRERNDELRGFEWGARHATPRETRPERALSIRQPWAELILRGVKTIEARSTSINLRGRVLIYASSKDVDEEARARVEGACGIDIRGLPRGVIVGSVDIVGCRPLRTSDSNAACFPVPRGTQDFAWLLTAPARATRLRKPRSQPQPMFFFPFK